MPLPEKTMLALFVARELLLNWHHRQPDTRENPGSVLMGVSIARPPGGRLVRDDSFFQIAAAEYMRLVYLDAGRKDALPEGVREFLTDSCLYVVPMLRACMTYDRMPFGPKQRHEWGEGPGWMCFRSDEPISERALERIVDVLALQDLVEPTRMYPTREYADRIISVGFVDRVVQSRARRYLEDGSIGEAHPAAPFLRALAAERNDVGADMKAIAGRCPAL